MIVRIVTFLLISLNIYSVYLVNTENIILYKEINLKNNLNPMKGTVKLANIRKFSRLKLIKEFVTESDLLDDIYQVELESGLIGYIFSNFTYIETVNCQLVLLKDITIYNKSYNKYTIFDLIFSTFNSFTLKDKDNNLLVTNTLKYFKIIVDRKDLNETLIENFNIVRIIDENSLIPIIDAKIKFDNKIFLSDNKGITYLPKNINVVTVEIDNYYSSNIQIKEGFNLIYTYKNKKRFSDLIEKSPSTIDNNNIFKFEHNFKNISDIYFVNENNEVFVLKKNSSLILQPNYYEIFYDDINTKLLSKNYFFYLDKAIDLDKIVNYNHKEYLIKEEDFNNINGNYKLQFTPNFTCTVNIKDSIFKMVINNIEYYFYINNDYLILLYSDTGYINSHFLNKIVVKYQFERFDNQLFLKNFEIIELYNNKKTKIFEENSIKKLFSYDILIFQKEE